MGFGNDDYMDKLEAENKKLKAEVEKLVNEIEEANDLRQGAETVIQMHNETMDRLEAELKIKTDALRKIAYPAQHLQNEAEKKGYDIDGRGLNDVLNDKFFYIEIAKRALINKE